MSKVTDVEVSAFSECFLFFVFFSFQKFLSLFCLYCRTCFACQVEIVDPQVYQCGKCLKLFCLDCDLFAHETLHSCPGCASFRNTPQTSVPVHMWHKENKVLEKKNNITNNKEKINKKNNIIFLLVFLVCVDGRVVLASSNPGYCMRYGFKYIQR